MISYNQALKILQDSAKASFIKSEIVKIKNSINRILSENLYSDKLSPSFDNSAMDGFALNIESIERYKQSIKTDGELVDSYKIPVQSVIAAGDIDFSQVKKVDCIEIMTGAAIPHSYFNAVIRIEDVEIVEQGQLKHIIFSKTPTLNQNIRKAGEDIKFGQLLLRRGTIINHQHILILATLGISEIPVYQKIQVALTSTGKELVDYDAHDLKLGQIRNSTGFYLESYLNSSFCDVTNLGITGDRVENYISLIESAFDKGARIFISTGAVSMGAFDFVKPALMKMGAEIAFHKCLIRPGKPILFASITYKNIKRYIFGVPGNVLSTAVGLNFFILPFIKEIFNISQKNKKYAKLKEDIKKPQGLTCFLKAKKQEQNGQLFVEALSGQSSFMVSPLIDMNCWLILPEHQEFILKDTEVEICEM